MAQLGGPLAPPRRNPPPPSGFRMPAEVAHPARAGRKRPGAPTRPPPTSGAVKRPRAPVLAALVVVALAWAHSVSSAGAQSVKGRQPQQVVQQPLQSPAGQLRQQQTQSYQAPAGRQSARGRSTARPEEQPAGGVQQLEQQRDDQTGSQTEDPLADSEPALYGSVAGQPGVDFPAYARIPKTSFTCEGKGFDFGFYADEEAGCQVYHVCWSGRRESFLCGVGTVFNQAILACDYWHSVDCSKSTQFYGVNSELGKAGAEPAANQRPARPSSSSSALSSGGTQFGEPITQRRLSPAQVPVAQQQQTSYGADGDDDSAPQARRPAPLANSLAPQRTSASEPPAVQQQRLEATPATKTGGRRVEQQPAPSGSAPAAPSQQSARRTQAARTLNMDYNQKVSSLIESPVRPPIRTPAGKAQPPPQRPQAAPGGTTRRPPAKGFAQLAVARAQQAAQRPAGAPARKSPPSAAFRPQQQQLEAEPEEPPQQLQQSAFDDSPVQTSTVQSAAGFERAQQQREPPFAAGVAPARQTVVEAGGGPDGSSAITMQYDTLQPAGLERPARDSSSSAALGGALDGYEGADEPPADDFRAAGAKAAASHNQNWYIMRTI